MELPVKCGRFNAKRSLCITDGCADRSNHKTAKITEVPELACSKSLQMKRPDGLSIHCALHKKGKPLTHDVYKMDVGYIQWLKGFGIVLVVIGHFYSSAVTSVWLENVRQVIYLFHMPLFMAISGFLYALSRPLSLGTLVKKKLLRLMVPYVSISGLVLGAKWIAEQVHFPLQYPIEREDIWAFLLYPQYGFACFLWFIYTLFMIFFIVRVLEMARIPLWLLFLTALGISLFPLPREFCLTLVGANLVYFVFGMGLRRILEKDILDPQWKEWALALGSLALFLLLAWMVVGKGMRGILLRQMTAFLGISSCWFFARQVNGRRRLSPMVWLGVSSSTIYLLHTPCMGTIRYAGERWLGIHSGSSQIIYFLGSVFFSLVIPSMIQRAGLAQFPLACKIFLGISKPQSNGQSKLG